jgi:hypothetical protein
MAQPPYILAKLVPAVRARVAAAKATGLPEPWRISIDSALTLPMGTPHVFLDLAKEFPGYHIRMVTEESGSRPGALVSEDVLYLRTQWSKQ